MGKVTDISTAPGFAPAPAARAAGKIKDKYILVVEDDMIIRDLVAELLRLEGYLVESARNGAEALRAIEQRRPDVLVLDMRMPTLNGWELADALKQRGIQMPVLVMTAATRSRADEWANEIGAVGYLVKPFDIEVLTSAVERLCQP